MNLFNPCREEKAKPNPREKKARPWKNKMPWMMHENWS